MRVIILFFLLISINGYSQWKSYKIGIRGDTLNRVDMKGLKQGPWVIQVPGLRGERGYEEEGYFVDDNKEGNWKRFSLEGIKIAEENYHWGKLHGKQQYFTYNGGLMREESWRAMDPAIAFDTVAVYDLKDPTKIKEYAVVKNDGHAVKHGRWAYYDPVEGIETGTENYWLGKIRTEDDEMIGDEDIKPLSIVNKSKSDTAGTKAKPQVVLDYEKKNSGKKKVKTRDGQTGY
ncbi:MAG: hypothetical protein HOP10_13945 [Chitinophagaceae bacterium]|nr:hypothetical protein [Chitinophagaceae bacterium]